MDAAGPDRAKKAPSLMGCFWSAAWKPASHENYQGRGHENP